jgi:hypothetical protein
MSDRDPTEQVAPSFSNAENVTELIYQLVGAGSMCWHGGTGSAVFDDQSARQIAQAGIDRLIELGWA